MVSSKIWSITTVLNIDNNKLQISVLEYDTELMAAENSVLPLQEYITF